MAALHNYSIAGNKDWRVGQRSKLLLVICNELTFANYLQEIFSFRKLLQEFDSSFRNYTLQKLDVKIGLEEQIADVSSMQRFDEIHFLPCPLREHAQIKARFILFMANNCNFVARQRMFSNKRLDTSRPRSVIVNGVNIVFNVKPGSVTTQFIDRSVDHRFAFTAGKRILKSARLVCRSDNNYHFIGHFGCFSQKFDMRIMHRLETADKNHHIIFVF